MQRAPSRAKVIWSVVHPRQRVEVSVFVCVSVYTNVSEAVAACMCGRVSLFSMCVVCQQQLD